MPSPNKNPREHSQTLTDLRKDLTKLLHIGQNEAFFSLSHFQIDGIKRGSLSHLTFRPNNGFHPIESVSFDQQKFHLTFEQEIKSIDRKLKVQEILDVIQQLKHAERNVVLGQEFYLYPSASAFILNQKNELKVLLRNIHPNQEPVVKSSKHYTVRAMLDLIKQHQPNLWPKIEKNSKNINTLEDIYQTIHSKSLLKTLGRLTWTVFILLILLFMLSLPIAAYGPSQMSEPLKKVYYPIFLSLSQKLEPASFNVKQPNSQSLDFKKAIPKEDD